MRILFIVSSRLGDAVIASGAIERIRKDHANARLTVACGAASAGLFSRLPRLERLIVFEKLAFDRHWLSLWSRLVRDHWHLIVDFRGSFLSFALRAQRRIIVYGGRRPGRRYEQIGEACGFDSATLPVAWTGPADQARAENLLPAGAAVLGLGPTANWEGKIWPSEYFVGLAKRLDFQRIAIFGGPGEIEHSRAMPVIKSLPGAIDLVGRLSIPEATACLERCAMFIGNDSGLMHLAAAAGVPTLGLFGRSRAAEYAPAGRLACSVVAPGPEGEAPMEGLTVDEVAAAAEELLHQTVAGVT